MVSIELAAFVVDHLQRIAREDGFVDGYKVELKAGSNVGDGAMAEMVGVRVSGQRKNIADQLMYDELDLICKLKPSNAARQEQFSSEAAFKREVFVYNKVLPTMVAFQQEHRVPSESAFTSFPKCYLAQHNEATGESLIIMQDLRADGFTLWDKHTSTQFEGVKLLMEQLGRLHGLSVAIRTQKPEVFQEWQDLPDIINKVFQTPTAVMMMMSGFVRAAKLLDDPQDKALMERFEKEYKPILLKTMEINLFSVFTHGDCWNNNMMYKLDKQVSLIKNCV